MMKQLFVIIIGILFLSVSAFGYYEHRYHWHKNNYSHDKDCEDTHVCIGECEKTFNYHNHTHKNHPKRGEVNAPKKTKRYVPYDYYRKKQVDPLFKEHYRKEREKRRARAYGNSGGGSATCFINTIKGD